MPYQVSWYTPGRVIAAKVYGVVIIEDVANLSREISEYVKQGTPLVHVLADLTGVEKYPTRLGEITRSITPIDNTTIGYSLVIGLNPLLRFITSAVSQIFKARYRSMATMEEALKFLAEVDSTLPDLTSVGEKTGSG